MSSFRLCCSQLVSDSMHRIWYVSDSHLRIGMFVFVVNAILRIFYHVNNLITIFYMSSGPESNFAPVPLSYLLFFDATPIGSHRLSIPRQESFHFQTVDHATGRVPYIYAKVELFCSWTFTAHCHWAAGANAVARQVWNMSGEARGYLRLISSAFKCIWRRIG